MKKCSRCLVTRPLDSFVKDRGASDGRFRWCKSCSKEHRAKYYADNRDSIAYKVAAKRKADPVRFKERAHAQYQKAKAGNRINRDAANERNRRYMASESARSKKKEAAIRRREDRPEKYMEQWLARNRRVAEELGDTYVARLMVRTTGASSVLPKRLIEAKREQVMLHRLAKRMDRAVIESTNGEHL